MYPANNAARSKHVKNGEMRRKQRDPKKNQQLLEIIRVLGMTTTTSTMLATSPGHDLIAYAAGSVAVLYNYKRNKQVAFLYAPPQPSSVSPSPQSLAAPSPYSSPQWNGSSSELDAATTGKNPIPVAQRPKSISCMRFSKDGTILAVGESGHTPRILIWDVKARTLIVDLKGHKFGVLALEFSPDGRFLVSLGFQHDGCLNVWDWRKGTILACNRVTSKVNALAFSIDGTYFVTAGVRHIKFWYLESDKGSISKRGSSKDVRILDGRSGILGELHDNNFVDCATDGKRGSENAYFVTQSGLLCMFSQGRVMDKWVNLQVRRAFSIDIDDMRILVACTDGIVRLFEVKTLKYQGTLPKPHPRAYDLAAPLAPAPPSTDGKTTEETYPDTVAVRYDGSAGKLVCVYSDRSLVLWDIKDTKKIIKLRTLSGHEACVWGAEIYSPQQNSRNPSKPSNSSMPLNTFITYSADGTARFWNLDLFRGPSSSTLISSRSTTSMESSNSTKRSQPVKEVLKVMYVDPECAEYLRSCPEPSNVESGESPISSTGFGIRSLRLSPDGKYLATGDKRGNLRVHDTRDWSELTYQEAHDSEILAIDFTNSEFRPPGNDVQTRIPYLLATASRDRLLHIFSVDDDFSLIQTLDDHSSSITGLRFSKGGQVLLSCSADKSVIFRSLYGGDRSTEADDEATALNNFELNGSQQPGISPTYITYQNHSGRATVFDVDVDSSHRFCYVVTGERRLHVLRIDNGKLHRSHKPDFAEESVEMGGSLLRVSLDPISYSFAVTSGSDKAIRLFDLASGTCIGRFVAHAELITCVKFMEVRGLGEDGRGEELRLISTCSDGSIYIWRVAEEIRLKMIARRDERLRKSPSEVVDITPYLQQEENTPPMSPSFENPPRKLSIPSITSEGTFIPVTNANAGNVNSRLRKGSGNSGSPDNRRRVSPSGLDRATFDRATTATTAKPTNHTRKVSGSGSSIQKGTIPLSSPVSPTQRTTDRARVRSSRSPSDSRQENATKLPGSGLSLKPETAELEPVAKGQRTRLNVGNETLLHGHVADNDRFDMDMRKDISKETKIPQLSNASSFTAETIEIQQEPEPEPEPELEPEPEPELEPETELETELEFEPEDQVDEITTFSGPDPQEAIEMAQFTVSTKNSSSSFKSASSSDLEDNGKGEDAEGDELDGSKESDSPSEHEAKMLELMSAQPAPMPVLNDDRFASEPANYTNETEAPSRPTPTPLKRRSLSSSFFFKILSPPPSAKSTLANNTQPEETAPKSPTSIRATLTQRIKKRLKRNKGENPEAVITGTPQVDGDSRLSLISVDYSESDTASSPVESLRSPCKSFDNGVETPRTDSPFQAESFEVSVNNNLATVAIPKSENLLNEENLMSDLTELVSLSRKMLTTRRHLLKNPTLTSNTFMAQIDATLRAMSGEIEHELGDKVSKLGATPSTRDHNLILEKYSEILVKMVQEKMT